MITVDKSIRQIWVKTQLFHRMNDKAVSLKHFLNPYLPNGLSHPYQLDESIFHLMGVWCTFLIKLWHVVVDQKVMIMNDTIEVHIMGQNAKPERNINKMA